MKAELSRKEYQLLVEKSPVMIWRSTLTMDCDYFNDTWLAFTGRSIEQEIGNGWAEGVHPEDFDRCLKIYTENFRRRTVFEMEYRLRRHDGVYRWIFDRGVPYSDDTDSFAGYIGSCIDVTEKIMAQQALNEAHESEIRQLQDILPICCYCKKIRNDENYWQQIELYISSHTNTAFTHGICPECMTKVMSEFRDKKSEAERQEK